MRRLKFLGAILVLWPWLNGFVLLSSDKATLPVTMEQPGITFRWDGKAPTIKEKDKYHNGEFSSLDDQAFMTRLLADAMDIWNNVPGAFIQLSVQLSETAVVADREDKTFSIIVAESSNASSAAFAQPYIIDGTSIISDCDITIADRETEAKNLAYTIVHELGHCLGLGHAHTNYNAVMGYSRTRRDISLGADDMAGLIYLYPDPKYDVETKESVSCAVLGGRLRHQPLGLAWLLLLLPAAGAAAAGIWRSRRPSTP